MTPSGLEPETFALKVRSSNQLSYEVIKVADMVGFEPTMWFPSQVNSLVLSASERHAKIIVVYSDNLLKFSGTPDRT